MTLLQSAFINVINLSIAASFLMLAVILLRPFLKRVPKWLVCALWALVAVRLVVPFSFESRWSLVPAWKVSVSHVEQGQAVNNGNQPGGTGMEDKQGETMTKNASEDLDAEQASAISAEKAWANPSEGNAGQEISHENNNENAVSMATSETKEHSVESHLGYETAKDTLANSPGNGQSESTLAESGTDESTVVTSEGMQGKTFTSVLQTVGSRIWIAGIIVMLAYLTFGSLRLQMRVKTAARLQTHTKTEVWQSDAIVEPFVLGIVKPKIYLPSSLGDEDLDCVLCHEQAHVKRGDYFWKPLGFLILSVYWFHPLCWISYLLFCRDVEMACDEKATKGFDVEERKRYCQTLLNLSQEKKNSLIGTVAFGENGTKSRIKAILDYKKPTFWVILAGVFICIALGIFFMTNSREHSIDSQYQKKPQGTDVVEDEGDEKETPSGPEKLLPEGEVIQINAFTTLGDYHYSFSDSESIKELKDYFDTLDLVADFTEKPEDFLGGSWVLEFTYSDQRTETICHYGNMFVRNSNGKWYKMKYEQAARLVELLGFEFRAIEVNDGEFNEIHEFMNYFMTFPVIWDFDQQNMSSAVNYFTQKWVWTDVTDLEYDAEANAFSVDSSVFTEKMGQYFVMSDSALRSIEEMTAQGRIKICADTYLPWFWSFSFRIDGIEVKEGNYYIHGYNAEVSENPYRSDDILLLGGNTDPFLEFNAVLVRDKEDGKLRLKEMDGLKYGPGRKANVSQVSDAEMKEMVEFAETFLRGPVLEQYDVNNLSGVFDFAAQKILETNPGAVREMDDGRCVVPLSVLMSYVEQHFYLPRGYEKCLPKEEGKNVYPCLAEDGVIFLKKENVEGIDLRSDLPVIQNERYYSFGVYNVNAENLRSKLVSEGKDLSTINSTVKEQYLFELAVLCAVRGADGKLRLLYFTPYYL